MSQLGLRHAPAPWTHGGVQVRGEIRRDAALNLVALRALGARRGEKTLALRRYILGLSLVSFTAPQDSFLREGCQLVPNNDRPGAWHVVRHDGKRESLNLSHDRALTYAQEAAARFKVGDDREATFNSVAAAEALGQSKAERKKSRRGRGRKSEQESGE